jgi:hypothetical protein
MTRGDVAHQKAEHIKSLPYFNQYDDISNDIDDFELFEKYIYIYIWMVLVIFFA